MSDTRPCEIPVLNSFKLLKPYDAPTVQDKNVLNIASKDNDELITTHFYLDSIVRLSINNLTIAALIDSGSPINCIRVTTLQKIDPHYKKQLTKPPPEEYTTASGSEMLPKGMINLNFTLSNVKCCLKFHAFEDLTQDVILGRDFLAKHEATLDYKSKSMSFLEKPKLITTSNHKLSPGECCLIQTKPTSGSRLILPTGLHGTTAYKHKRNGLTVYESAVTCSNNMIPVIVKNENMYDVKIKSGTSLTRFEPLAESECPQYQHNISTIDSTEQQTREDTPSTASEKPQETLPFDLEKSACTGTQRKDLETMLYKHRAAFIDSSGKLGRCDLVEHKIKLKPDAQPIAKNPYRMSPEMKEAVQKQIKRLLKLGVIQEGDSEWSSPLIAVKKNVKKSRKHLQKGDKSGKEIRVVVDFRWLNLSSIYNRVEIPSISSLLDTIGQQKPKFYTSLDLKDGYHQMPLAEESRKLTNFLVPGLPGSYQYVTTPFGLHGAPMSFQRMMTKVLKQHITKCVVIYLDDVCVFSKDWNSHLTDLDAVLQSFEEASLKLNPAKCSFARRKCKYLGHELSEKGVSPSDDHIESVRTYPVPTTVKQLRTFLGLATFFSMFIPHKGTLMSPLIALTKKNAKWDWTTECPERFDKIKQILSSKPVLRFPDFNKRFHVFADSSLTGLGAVLLQEDEETGAFYAVSYCGRALNKGERKRPIMELECLATVYALTTWDIYLSGRPFTLCTDNSSLQHILNNKKKQSPKLERWVLFLSQYDFEIKHTKGLLNSAADALSRRDYDYSRTGVDDKIESFPDFAGINTILASVFPTHNNQVCVTTRAKAKQLEELDKRAEIENRNFQTEKDPDTGDEDTVRKDDIQQNKPKSTSQTNNPQKKNLPRREVIDEQLLAEKIQETLQNDTLAEFNTDKIREEQQKDVFCKDLIDYIEHDVLPSTLKRQKRVIIRENDYIVDNGLLFNMWAPIPSTKHTVYLRLVIPKSLQEEIIRAVHCTTLGAHAGVQKTVSILRTRFSWQGMMNDVKRFIGSCDACLMAKTQPREQVPRTLYELAEVPFQRISVDFLGAFAKSKHGNMYCVTVVDSFSGYLITWPCRNTLTESFVRDFYQKVICVYSVPAKLRQGIPIYFKGLGATWQPHGHKIGKN